MSKGKEKLIVEIDFYQYKLKSGDGSLKSFLHSKGFDLQAPMKWESNPKTGDVTFIQ